MIPIYETVYKSVDSFRKDRPIELFAVANTITGASESNSETQDCTIDVIEPIYFNTPKLLDSSPRSNK